AKNGETRGDSEVMLLAVNSAIGSQSTQSSCRYETYERRNCSITPLTRSVCPSVSGWNAV
ncbi:hypothetical protein K402DRAFT_296169, partial [Aulographum hederae CBS 113979]